MCYIVAKPYIWEAQVDTEYGTVYSELILEHTRTFSQQEVLHNLMTWVNSFTYFYTPVDANSMVLEDHIMGTRWTVYRK